jgi:hypothetical protein
MRFCPCIFQITRARKPHAGRAPLTPPPPRPRRPAPPLHPFASAPLPPALAARRARQPLQTNGSKDKRQPRTRTAPRCQLSPRRQLLAKTASRRLFARIAIVRRSGSLRCKGGRAGPGLHLALLDGVRGRRAPPVLDRRGRHLRGYSRVSGREKSRRGGGGRHLRGLQESGTSVYVTEFGRVSD